MAYYNGDSDENDYDYDCRGYDDDYYPDRNGYYDERDHYDHYDERDHYDPYDDYYNSEEEDYPEEDDHSEEADEATPRRHFKYAPEESAATIKDTILEIMTKNNIHPAEIPPEPKPHFPCELPSSLQFFDTKAFAWFSCPTHDNRWPSAHAWCYLDLKTQKIRYRFLQECKKCNKKASPEFPVESVERMANFAVRMYLKRKDKPIKQAYHPGAEPFTSEGKPHDEGRCGKCQYLGRSCWK